MNEELTSNSAYITVQNDLKNLDSKTFVLNSRMNIDLIGRISNVVLGYNRPLIPLFEAVVNSIHSIQSADIQNGKIIIYVERDNSQNLLDYSDSDTRPIHSFIVEDNGLGFDEANYNSFTTSDTKFKVGAKGIGRFTWLKAFDSVHVKSVFKSNGSNYERKFDFLLTPEGVENLSVIETKEPRKTVVKLSNYKPKFQEKCYKNIQTIAEKIIEHCLIYFLSGKCPQIIITDGTETFILNELYENNVKGKTSAANFTLKNHVFYVVNLRLYLTDEKKHKAYFCANDRVVKSINLEKRIPDINAKLIDEDGVSFRFGSYISGEYFDKNVNNERTDFHIDQEPDAMFPDMISLEEIENAALKEMKKYLDPYLSPISKNKIEHIHHFIETEAPQYRSIAKYKPELLENIEPGLSKEKLDLELHKIKSKLSIEIKEQTQELIEKKTEDIRNVEEYLIEYNKLISKISGISSDQLAEYILHRKSIISLLDKSISLTESGKYELEEAIHRIIFPMRTTSDDIDYENQNLWLIDERLSYHHFLASDKPFSKIDPVEMKGKDRADLVIFNKALAYAEDSSPFSSIVIVEFKRPMRNDFSDEENPFVQVMEYITDIRDAKVNDKNGRPIRVGDNVPFYVYIICDLTSKIEKLAVQNDYTHTPDGQGYFKLHNSLNAYIEVISFDKLVNDAKKRNRVLFDKLNLPAS